MEVSDQARKVAGLLNKHVLCIVSIVPGLPCLHEYFFGLGESAVGYHGLPLSSNTQDMYRNRLNLYDG